jgi:hypothetical protein
VRRVIIGLAVAWLAVLPAYAKDYEVENWTIKKDWDKFDGSPRVIATLTNANAVPAIRCMRRRISLALVEFRTQHYAPGDLF